MKEDYVSYELAKALKEAGFDVPCLLFYTEKVHLLQRENAPFSHLRNFNDREDMISAPTLALAHKWLREVKGIAISVIAHEAGCYDWFEAYLPAFGDKDKMYDMLMQSMLSQQQYFDIYEEALSDGLTKMLELINKK